MEKCSIKECQNSAEFFCKCKDPQISVCEVHIPFHFAEDGDHTIGIGIVRITEQQGAILSAHC